DGIRGFHVTGVQTCALPIFAALSFSERDTSTNTTTRESKNAPDPSSSSTEPHICIAPRLKCRMANHTETSRTRAVIRARNLSPQIGRASCREREGGQGGGGA